LLDAGRRVHAHLQSEEKSWIQERIEGPDKGVDFTEMGKKAILQKLIEAEGFEQFIDVKYKGTKRFGLDGGESLIPALEQIIKRGGNMGLKEIVFGMAHRGRLNVLTQVMGSRTGPSSTSSRAARSSPTRSRARAT
jgi:2-oxoglutarate dehydrogenase E1 component